jgi:hypothetical protein
MTRRQKLAVAAASMLLAAITAGLVIGLLPKRMPLAATGPLAGLILLGAFLTIRPYWRRLDHMQRDSRLVSWYWGGGFGGGLGLVLAVTVAGVRSPLFAGAALVWGLQFAGYATARLRWWLAHRAPSV